MTEVPEHLLRRAAAAKSKAAVQRGEAPLDENEVVAEMRTGARRAADAASPPPDPVETLEAMVEDRRVEQVRLAEIRLERDRKIRHGRVIVTVVGTIVCLLIVWAAYVLDRPALTDRQCWARGGTHYVDSGDCALPPPPDWGDR